MGDAYFNRLHDLRNDSAQESRRQGGGAPKQKPVAEIIPSGGDEGCESMHNDKRDTKTDANTGCEAI